jgi:hypothetical protein
MRTRLNIKHRTSVAGRAQERGWNKGARTGRAASWANMLQAILLPTDGTLSFLMSGLVLARQSLRSAVAFPVRPYNGSIFAC